MENHKITGGGGIQLHLTESGDPKGRPILFIHGFSQSWLAWLRQMNSSLAATHRLVAMDIRGHGHSDKPREGYTDSQLWADDIDAAIRALRLDHPILCGWSYGPLLILDYIRHYGEDNIAGIVFVGGVTKLGSDAAISVLDGEFLSLIPSFFSTEAEESVNSLKGLLRLCFAQELSAEDSYRMLGYNVSVPPYVRQALFARSYDNDDLLPRIHKPTLIVHGAHDRVVKLAAVDQHKSGLPHAQAQIMPNAGHAAFWDDAPGFNRHLQAFSVNL